MLINLRNALMAGKRLPYDAEVEYLQSTGTQWIDTGYVPTSTSGAQVVGEFISLPTSDYSGFFGCKTTGVNDRFWAVSSNQNNGTIVGFGNNYMMASASLNTIYTTQVNYKNSRTATFTGTTNVSGFNNGGTKPVFLFAVNIGARAYYQGSMRIYSAQLTESSEIVRDYIPVRKGTVGYMYDRVSGKLFGNAGTGDFVVGPDVVPVEYIESHGTEWIDTGFIPGLNFHIDARGRKAGDYSVNAAIFSNEGVNSYIDCYYNAGWGVRCYGDGMSRPIYEGWFDAKIDFDFTSSPTTTFHLNSEEATATTSKTEAQITGSTKSVRLFQGMYGKTNPVDIVFFNADKSGQPALRLIAVRVGTGSTWEGAMMDVLTRRVYRNQGTGAFTYGNDLKYPIPA